LTRAKITRFTCFKLRQQNSSFLNLYIKHYWSSAALLLTTGIWNRWWWRCPQMSALNQRCMLTWIEVVFHILPCRHLKA
jgi:hypothetical protein